MTTPTVVIPKVALDKPVPKEAIETVVKRIADEFKPEKIILFGSHAYGDPKPWSDVDLLVVMDTDLNPREQRKRISRFLSPHPFGMDIVVRATKDLEERIRERDYFLREIVNKGKVMYARQNK